MALADFYPITRDFGMIKASRAGVVAAFENWMSSLDRRWERKPIVTSLEDGLLGLQPLTMAMDRELWVSTESDWTAFFSNGLSGSDPFGPMSFLAGRLETIAMRICSTEPEAMWPAVIWEVYAPSDPKSDTLGYRRALAAANDGGRWIFSNNGEPFPFEARSAYTARKKRDRFTHQMLVEYLDNFGLKPFEESFFSVSQSNPAMLIYEANPAWKDATRYSLKDVQKGLPWRTDSSK